MPVADLRSMPPDEAYAYAVMEDAVPVYEEFLLVYPNVLCDVIGFVLVAVVLASQWLRKEPSAAVGG